MDEFEKLFESIAQVQDPSWNGSRKECYWNLYYPRKNYEDSDVCVSESLAEFKMTPNTTECKGYWNYFDACGCNKGE